MINATLTQKTKPHNKQRRFANTKKFKGEAKAYRQGRLTHTKLMSLNVTHATFHNGYRILTDKGPLLVDALNKMIETTVTTYLQWDRVFATRVDLYFPTDWSQEQRLAQDYFSKFIRSLNEQLNHLNSKLAHSGNQRDLAVRFFRSIEVAPERGLHIHCLLLFNGHQHRSLGDFGKPHIKQWNENGEPTHPHQWPLNNTLLQQDSLGRKILAAWASALLGYDRTFVDKTNTDWRLNTPNSAHIEKVFNQGLVHFAKSWSPSKHHDTSVRKQSKLEQLEHVIFAGCYLCKAASKQRLQSGAKGFIKVTQSSSAKRNPKGTQRAERLHRFQVKLPLFNPFNQSDGFELSHHELDLYSQLDHNDYILRDLQGVNRYLEESIQHHHRSIVMLSFELELNEQALQQSYSTPVIPGFIRELNRDLQLEFNQDWYVTVPAYGQPINTHGWPKFFKKRNPEYKVFGLQKEVLYKGQRKLKLGLLISKSLYDLVNHTSKPWEQRILAAASFTLEAMLKAPQGPLRLDITHCQYKREGDRCFIHLLNHAAEFAQSENTPPDLAPPYIWYQDLPKAYN
ncbi:inovirus-type Gp2 protein [Thiomicrospira sp. ALE5]|uniref:YagK/YfjJ domain-containing protein n=1 Tax=Thiomicrospira sp. ALE5 TaxID=748650 RepID=UPI0008DF47BE|nr:inovirus-type Gp2 protein [Thiomicrospira sp. ALE5]SFR52627.1 Protein of unknown function [Thiomicrospira sp. ALE5]